MCWINDKEEYQDYKKQFVEKNLELQQSFLEIVSPIYSSTSTRSAKQTYILNAQQVWIYSYIWHILFLQVMS